MASSQACRFRALPPPLTGVRVQRPRLITAK